MSPGKVNGLRFFDGQGEETDILQGFELHVLNQVTQRGDRDPFLVLVHASASYTASARS